MNSKDSCAATSIPALLSLLLLFNRFCLGLSDDYSPPECPYPCLPPPTSAANYYPPPTSAANYYPPPPPSTQPTWNRYPPSGTPYNGYNSPPPAGTYYAPPYDSLAAPPPPNPILPWFPFYYSRPPPLAPSSSNASRSGAAIFVPSAVTALAVSILLC